MVYVLIPCHDCGYSFTHPSDREAPALAYCPDCALLRDRNIKKKMSQSTGHMRGGYSSNTGFTPPETQNDG